MTVLYVVTFIWQDAAGKIQMKHRLLTWNLKKAMRNYSRGYWKNSSDGIERNIYLMKIDTSTQNGMTPIMCRRGDNSNDSNNCPPYEICYNE